MGNELPNKWIAIELEQLYSHIIGGDWGKDPQKVSDDEFVEVVCIRGSEIKNWEKDKGNTASIRAVKNSSLANRELQIGDILLEISGGGPDQPVGRTVYIDEDVFSFQRDLPRVCTNFLRLVRLVPVINKKFINHYLQYFYKTGEVVNYQGGSNNLRNLKFKDYSTIQIPLPPFPEQNRIVEKLDAIFGHLEQLKTKLDKIPGLLKNFRQAVLNQAVTGKLTQDWRAGKELGEWRKSRLEDIAGVIDPHPSHRTPPQVENGVPYVSIKDVTKGRKVTLESARIVSVDILKEHQNRYRLKKGDFVFGKIGTIGRPVILPEFEKKPYTLSANVILIQPDSEKIEPIFLYYYLDSPVLIEEVTANSSATSQSAFGIKKMRNLLIPTPNILEQQEIVSRVKSLFAKADKIEQQYQTLKEKIDQLPQAILAKAFKGELVEQLPTDGSARELLEQIQKAKAELEKTGKTKPRRDKSRKLKKDVDGKMAAEPKGRYYKPNQ